MRKATLRLTKKRGLQVIFIVCSCLLLVSLYGYSNGVQSKIVAACQTVVQRTHQEEAWLGGLSPDVPASGELRTDDIKTMGPSTSIPMNPEFSETEFDRMIFTLQDNGYVVLHQTWKDTCILETKVKHMKSWETIEKKLKVIFWTDDSMDAWLYSRFNGTYIYQGWELLKTCDKAHIKKADVFRAMLIWYYGGIYADLDIEIRQSFVEFLEEKTTLVSWEPREAMERWSAYKSGDAKKTFMLSGFLLCGERHSNFVAFLCSSILLNHIQGRSPKSQEVIFATGPAAEANAYYRYTEKLDEHDGTLHVMTYREFSHYAEHYSATTWLPGSIQGIGCVEIDTIYSNTTLIMGNPL